jgi:hypothetical protein
MPEPTDRRADRGVEQSIMYPSPQDSESDQGLIGLFRRLARQPGWKSRGGADRSLIPKKGGLKIAFLSIALKGWKFL